MTTGDSAPLWLRLQNVLVLHYELHMLAWFHTFIKSIWILAIEFVLGPPLPQDALPDHILLPSPLFFHTALFHFYPHLYLSLLLSKIKVKRCASRWSKMAKTSFECFMEFRSRCFPRNPLHTNPQHPYGWTPAIDLLTGNCSSLFLKSSCSLRTSRQ